eukprot:GABV01000066.1.p1 GENE.GABV01000066.1~~GABV01000066.1.p1  ORF type:complete len:531 (+),score=242.17 GABV01000066.1:681-2273(+)
MRERLQTRRQSNATAAASASAATAAATATATNSQSDSANATSPDKNTTMPSATQAEVANSIFGQAFRRLIHIAPALLRPGRPSGGHPHIGFEIKLRGEHAVGEAGPYRQFFTDVCRELQEELPRVSLAAAAAAAAGGTKERKTDDAHENKETAAQVHTALVNNGGGASSSSSVSGVVYTLPFFIPCPNRLMQVGENRDKMLPRPGARSVVDLSGFEFLGRLMGVAIRTNVLLPLDLPSFFWKPLVGVGLDVTDLEGVDKTVASGVIAKLEECQQPQEFDQWFGGELTWSTLLSDGVRATHMRRRRPRQQQHSQEEGEDDDDLHVTFGERAKFAEWLTRVRLNESQRQIRAVGRGLASIVPEELLSLMTWQELERLVCGVPTIDVELLKRHTEYSNCNESDPHIQHFWTVLREFSQEERRKFLKFVWAQERLPSSDAEFSRGGHKVRLLIKGPPQSNDSTDEAKTIDASFPRADTCFGNCLLPRYSSLEVMRRQLTLVINLDAGMDADENADVEEFGRFEESVDLSELLQQ